MPLDHQSTRSHLHALWQCADDRQRAAAMTHVMDRLIAAQFNGLPGHAE